MTEQTNECDHDWRRNPFLTLASNPPGYQVVCVNCGKRGNRFAEPSPYKTNDPRTWPPA